MSRCTYRIILIICSAIAVLFLLDTFFAGNQRDLLDYLIWSNVFVANRCPPVEPGGFCSPIYFPYRWVLAALTIIVAIAGIFRTLSAERERRTQ